MAEKYILFLSTNNIWGGSEVLWTEAARFFLNKGYTIKAGISYPYAQVQAFIPVAENCIDLQNRMQQPGLFFRILNKLRIFKFTAKDVLHEHFKKQQPNLVIISQGNNIDGKCLMEDCIKFNIPFVTITHLVTEVHWPMLNDEIIEMLNTLYHKAKYNYFVSNTTLQLHQKLLGYTLTNSVVIYNPFIKNIPTNISFPAVEKDIYKVALIGRIENFHKGYDLLIEILNEEKWKTRAIHFSIFGKGPHVELLKRLIIQNKISNLSIHHHIENIATIWQTHHILMMPSRMEGQSLTLIEAMRFSRAAIVTNVGGTGELVEEGFNGFVAAYANTASIDEALERAWQKRAQWEQLGKNAATTIALKHPANALLHFTDQIETLLAG